MFCSSAEEQQLEHKKQTEFYLRKFENCSDAELEVIKSNFNDYPAAAQDAITELDKGRGNKDKIVPEVPRNNVELVDGWRLNIDEVSNNVYQVELIDKSGRKTGAKDHDLKQAIEACLGFAFDIERQLGNNINKFSYDTLNYFLGNGGLTSKYSDLSFGSWIIATENQRIILDGKESVLLLQHKNRAGNWTDLFSKNLGELSFADLKAVVDRFG